MPSSMHLYGERIFPQRLDDMDVRAYCGAMLYGIPPIPPIPMERYARVVQENAVQRMVLPDGPITKMARREHIDSFFREGRLRLGTFSYFNRFDHEEIGDRTEGSFVLAGRSSSKTAIAKMAGGFDHYAFCCYSGEPDRACIERFGYNDAFTITAPAHFAEAISRALGAKQSEYASCVYSPHKAIVGEVPEDFSFGVISHHLLGLATSAKYYVKPDRYSHQREFRFLWQMHGDLSEPLDLFCPEATQYCVRAKGRGV